MLWNYWEEKKHSNDALCLWVEETLFMNVCSNSRIILTGELPARFELGNMDLEKQERSPKWEKLILEGDQFQ